MAYEKQTWANGDVITAEKLNHMEDGIDSVMFVEVTGVSSQSSRTFSKTWKEIDDALKAGKVLRCVFNDQTYGINELFTITGTFTNGINYYLVYTAGDVVRSFRASSEDEYPKYQES